MENQHHCMSLAHMHNLLNSFCNNGYVYVKTKTKQKTKQKTVKNLEIERENALMPVTV